MDTGLHVAVARMLKFHSPGNLIEEVNRTNAAEALHAEPERWREITDGVLADDGWCTFEERFRCRDGTMITCALHLRAAAGNDERFEIHGFIEDISERKRSENSLKLSQLIIDNASIGIFRGDHKGNIVYANEHGARALGFSREEMLSMSIEDIDPFFVLKDWQNHIEEIRQTGSIHLPNRFHRAKNGRIIPVEITTNYLFYDGVEYYCAIVRDTTERVKAEKTASFFRALIEYTRDPVYVLDPADGGRMLYVNQAACSHFGLSLEKMRTMRISDWIPDWDMERVRPDLQRIKEGRPFRFETMHRIASGGLVPVEVTANYLEHDGRALVAGVFSRYQ